MFKLSDNLLHFITGMFIVCVLASGKELYDMLVTKTGFNSMECGYTMFGSFICYVTLTIIRCSK